MVDVHNNENPEYRPNSDPEAELAEKASQKEEIVESAGLLSDLKLPTAQKIATREQHAIFAYHADREDASWIAERLKTTIEQTDKDLPIVICLEEMIVGGLPRDADGLLTKLHTRTIAPDGSQIPREIFEEWIISESQYPGFLEIMRFFYDEALAEHAIIEQHYLEMMQFPASADPSLPISYPEFDSEIVKELLALQSQGYDIQVRNERAPLDSYLGHIRQQLVAKAALQSLRDGNAAAARTNIYDALVAYERQQHLRERSLLSEFQQDSQDEQRSIRILIYGLDHADVLSEKSTDGKPVFLSIARQPARFTPLKQCLSRGDLLDKSGRAVPENTIAEEQLNRELLRRVFRTLVGAFQLPQEYWFKADSVLRAVTAETLALWTDRVAEAKLNDLGSLVTFSMRWLTSNESGVGKQMRTLEKEVSTYFQGRQQ